MCRIAGIICGERPFAGLVRQVEVMCDVMKHGGPDDGGIFADQSSGVILGHRRLSIIDLSDNGHQPMTDRNNKVWITFNGEIYNFHEIRSVLLNDGWQFNSGTDTEVVINAYLKWGKASFAKLRGMFAFALYDTAKGITYLVRDTTGIKPLYYCIEERALTFASEVKAFRIAGVVTQSDENWMVRFLAFGQIPEPYTTLKNVFSLAKGHLLEWKNATGEYKISAYAMPVEASKITSIQEAGELIRDTLNMAVRRQLIADAPIGVFLSGGIDSSLITLLAAKYQQDRLETISIYFDEKAYDERVYQQQIFKHISGGKHRHLVRQQDFEKYFPQIVEDMDMPTTDGINTWFISKYAKEDGLKVVLSGVGSDELFGGYPSFNRIKYLRYLRKIPAAFFKQSGGFIAGKYKKIVFLAHRHPLADYLFLRGIFVPYEIAGILGAELRQVNEILFDNALPAVLPSYDEEHAAWFEKNLYMQNQLLRDTDMMSMSHGLEVRVPFLDEDMQLAAARIAPAIRFDKQQPKKILTDSFIELLPEAIWKRPKMGFTFPLQDWMRSHHEITNDTLYSGKVARDVVRRFKAGKMHWSKLFALYQIQKHD